MNNSSIKERSIDLAGYQYPQPHYLQTRSRINYLIERYLSLEILQQNLADLPRQFENPHQRHWETIDWQAITSHQIIGVAPELFMATVANAVEIETPIRAYAKESWDYLQAAHFPMARFVGGTFAVDGTMLEVGIWEK